MPERVRFFMWQVRHKRLLTRQLMGKWDGGTGLCEICRAAPEDLIHALRDCHYAAGIWKKMVRYERRRRFFTLDWNDWLTHNLMLTVRSEEDVLWHEYFAVTCWFLWQWRNAQIHNNELKVPWNASERIVEYIRSYETKGNMLLCEGGCREIIRVKMDTASKGLVQT